MVYRNPQSLKRFSFFVGRLQQSSESPTLKGRFPFDRQALHVIIHPFVGQALAVTLGADQGAYVDKRGGGGVFVAGAMANDGYQGQRFAGFILGDRSVLDALLQRPGCEPLVNHSLKGLGGPKASGTVHRGNQSHRPAWSHDE